MKYSEKQNVESLVSLETRYAGITGADMLAPMIQEEFAGQIALVSSFGIEAAVLLHMVARIDPATPVLFIDTGKLFEETHQYRAALVERLGLQNVQVLQPDAGGLKATDPGGELHKSAPDSCCDLRKTRPLEEGLAPYAAWITGRKRFHGGLRTDLPLIESQAGRIKINPLANWSKEQIDVYFVTHDLPPHPLAAEGYLSIGCAPCTKKTDNVCDVRDGRWSGIAKTECGIHLDENGRIKRAG